MEKKIPTLSADGQRWRGYSLEAIERLRGKDLVTVERGRRGQIKVAYFRKIDGANPIQATAHMGTRYSFEEPLRSGHFAWTHRELVRDDNSLAAIFGVPPDDRADAERYVRAIFRAVPLSCMKQDEPTPPEPTPPAKVIPFAGKRKRTAATARPLEFDSQWRKAA